MRKWTQRSEATCLKFHSLQEVGLPEPSTWCGRGTLPMASPLSRALEQGTCTSVHCCLPEQAAVWVGDDPGDSLLPSQPCRALPPSSFGHPSSRCLLEPRPPCAWRRGQSSLAAGFRSGRAGLSLPFSSWVTLGKSVHLSEPQFSDLGIKCDHTCQA